jgi:hypothetical protein
MFSLKTVSGHMDQKIIYTHIIQFHSLLILLDIPNGVFESEI